MRPAADEAVLNRLDEADTSALRPQFVDGVGRLAALLFARAAPKRIGAQLVTGPALAGLARAYVAAINAGAVPTISTAWQGVADAECRRAAAAAEEAYRREFDAETVAPEPAALEAEHRRALAEAKAVFKAHAVGDAATVARHKSALLEAATRHFELHRDRALARAEAAAEGLLAEAAGRLSAAARLKERWADVLGEFDAVVEAYKQRAAGPTKWPRLVTFLQQQFAHASNEWAAREADKAERRLQDERLSGREALTRVKEAEAKAARAEARAADLVAAEAATRAQLLRERQERFGGLFACFGGGGGGGAGGYGSGGGYGVGGSRGGAASPGVGLSGCLRSGGVQDPL